MTIDKQGDEMKTWLLKYKCKCYYVLWGGRLACVAGSLVNYVNVFGKRAARATELRSPKHIVNAIYYNLISQQQWLVGTCLHGIVLYI